MSNSTAGVGNPYDEIEATLLTLMYPTFAPGLDTRLEIFSALLSYILALAIIYLGLTIIKARKEGRDLWLVKIVKRPQGHYVICSQHIFYPLGVVITAATWLAFTIVARGWWVYYKDTANCFYWILFKDIPAFVLFWATTYAVISTANLASSRTHNPSHHILPPKIANSIFFVLLPAFLILIFVTGARGGSSFHHLHSLWRGLHDNVLRQQAEFQGNLTQAEYDEVIRSFDVLRLRILGSSYEDFLAFQKVAAIAFLVSIMSILAINIIGGIFLVWSLRVTDSRLLVQRGAPVVAPLGPLATEATVSQDASASVVSFLKLQRTMTTDFKNGAEGVEDNDWSPPVSGKSMMLDGRDEKEGTKEDKSRAPKRLDWELTLFYLTVAPACVAYSAYQFYIIAKAKPAFRNGPQVEFATTGMSWVLAGFTAIALTAVCIKRIRSLRAPKNRNSLHSTFRPNLTQTMTVTTRRPSTPLDSEEVLEVTSSK